MGERGIKAVLLDIGGVLLEVDKARMFESFEQIVPKKKRHLVREVEGVGFFHAYETGSLTTEEFMKKLNKFLGTDIDSTKLLEIWNHCLVGLVHGVEEVIEKVSSQVPLYCLSNTNPAHYEYFKNEFEIFSKFQKVFTSFEMGIRKPDEEIFEEVLEHLNVRPQEVLFVDDLRENIAAARGLEIQSVRCENSATRLEQIFESHLR